MRSYPTHNPLFVKTARKSRLRRTLDNWRQEYNCERPHSSLAYRTPAEFSRALGYGDVESKQRFPHPHSPDYDGGEIYSPTNLNRDTPAING